MSETTNNDPSCAICLMRQRPFVRQERLQCGHTYCAACIGQWRKTANATCPMCRQSTDVLRIYRRDTAEEGLGAILLDHAYRKRYGNQFCEPTSVMIGAEIATVFFLPVVAFDAEMVAFFKSFGYEAHSARDKERQSNDFRILDHIDAHGAVNAKILLRCVGDGQQLEQRVSQARREAMQRIYKDPRIALLCHNNPQDFSKRLFPLYCRMIEFEVACDEEPCISLHCILPEFGLQDSPMATAIAKDGLDNPAAILDRFGDQWRFAAQNIPQAEVEHVLCSMQNIVNSRVQRDEHQMTMMHENEARSIILFNRVRHCFCACCAKKLPAPDEMQVQTCKKCQSAFYCSLECYETEFMSHVRYCCKEAARRERGIREISLASNAHAQQVPGAMSRGQRQFNAEELVAALQLAST